MCSAERGNEKRRDHITDSIWASRVFIFVISVRVYDIRVFFKPMTESGELSVFRGFEN